MNNWGSIFYQNNILVVGVLDQDIGTVWVDRNDNRNTVHPIFWGNKENSMILAEKDHRTIVPSYLDVKVEIEIDVII